MVWMIVGKLYVRGEFYYTVEDNFQLNIGIIHFLLNIKCGSYTGLFYKWNKPLI